MGDGEGHEYGGKHTNEKLAVLSRYMAAYTIALKHQEFGLAYIDAFAGSGDRVETLPALPLLGSDAERITVPGSARLALQTDPPFDVLVLVETDPGRYAALQHLAAEWPDRKVRLCNEDANGIVQRLCRNLPWHESRPGMPGGMRGLLFLDPYGMEVDWATIEAVAATEAVDMWCFFPLMGLYRQAPREILRIDETQRRRLNAVLGTTEWEDRWYGNPHGPTDLFQDPATAVRIADVNAIEEYVRERLAGIFRGTVLTPRRIFNANGSPIASLFFAVANPNRKAVAVATRIAGHILNSGSSSQTRPL